MRKDISNVLLTAACAVLLGCAGAGPGEGTSVVNKELMPVKQDGIWGFADQKGSVVIEPAFSSVTPFVDGLAAVCVSGDGDETGWALIDMDGNYVVRPSYSDLTAPSEGIVWAMDGDVATALDTDGKKLFELPQADMVWGYSDGLARFTCPDSTGNRVYGFVDKKGKVAIEPIFEDAGDFSDGVAEVKKDGERYYIDKDGNNAFGDQTFKAFSGFRDGRATVFIDNRSSVSGVIDRDGKLLFTQPGVLKDGGDGYIYYTKEGTGWVDSKGEVVIEPQFEAMRPFYDNDLAPFKLGDRSGFVDRSGQIRLNPQWDDASSFVDNSFAYVAIGDKWGMIDRNGKYLVNPKWEDVSMSYVNGCNGQPYVGSVMSDFYFVDCAAVIIRNFIKDGRIDGWDLSWTAEDIAKHIGMSRYMYGRYGREHMLKRMKIGTSNESVNALIYLRGEFFKNQTDKAFAPLDYVEGVKPDNVMIQFWQDDYRADWYNNLFIKLETMLGLEHHADGQGQYGIGKLAGHPLLLSEFVSPNVGRKGVQIEFGKGISFPSGLTATESSDAVDDGAGDDYVEDTTYEGTVGDSPIVMELGFGGDGTMSGRYRYKSEQGWITLSGTNDDGVIDLTETVDGKTTGSFSLALNDFSLMGTWTDSGKTKLLKVELHSVE